MRLAVAFTAVAAVFLTACATRTAAPDKSVQVRTRAPINYQRTVNDYIDLTAMLPADRRLAIGAPEMSNCPLFSPGGSHAGWVVPVVHDTTPSPARPTQVSTAPVPRGKSAAAPSPSKTSASGTASRADVALDEVQVSGTRYFFWFSSETLAGVTRRADLCP